jgi:hypothetical protein
MSRRTRLLRLVEHRWFERFGEPPPIRTDPELILSILEEDERREALSMIREEDRREAPLDDAEHDASSTEDASPAFA